MKHLPRIVVILATALLVAAEKQDEQLDQGPPRPPEMKVLERFIGTWKAASISKQAEWSPEETRSTGTSKNELTLGGRFVQSKNFDSQGKLSNIQMFTYDPVNKEYRQWYFDSRGNTLQSSGRWDESTHTITFRADVGNGITSVFAIRFLDDDSTQFTVVTKDKQGKVYFDMQGKSTRRK